jgi:hypothetical protein
MMLIRPCILAAACLVLSIAISGCVPVRGGWDLDALEERYPALRALEPNRLGDLAPHFLPDREGLTLFLCRWPSDAPIRVSLPMRATDPEIQLFRGALSAWQAAGLGVGFVEATDGAADIELRLADEGGGGWVPEGTGDTATDCAVPADFDAVPEPDRVPARLRFSSVYLRRSNVDALGRLHALSADELIGSIAHELGHALGFATHVGFGRSIMSNSPEIVRKLGAAINAGEGLSEPTLAALYALPTGVVVGHIGLPVGQDEPVRLAAELARREGLRGPFVRVGDRSARIFWRDAKGVPISFTLEGWARSRAAPDSWVFQPNAPARLLLLQSREEP